ncbi:hypothetical protein Bb109J_c2550 [Bdellovibrio bacteriovorus]|uniref:hypothetical protein n=1 Tax=Bdellovibrio bacteriovorus TaxID=959 RepID=UPI00045C06A7|nr:hypothetical protein [Bdellovibrio bacteriovorus]AHZ85237.1 hypothetical protein EP01_09845 [Bdellovibrio bacteriovorus]BEV69130.1 hypothetical protein Bb109J_c2550 [Bdellovibrio bacteriovorus]
MRFLVFVIFLVFLSGESFAGDRRDVDYSGPSNWNEFRAFVHNQQKEDEQAGLAYMISGAVAAIGGTVGYQQSEEIFSRTIFAITSNVGLAAIGLGATYYYTGNEMDSFFYAIDGSSLSLAEKNEVLQRFLLKEREEKEKRKWIRVATHALLAAANIYSATQEENSDVRSVFYFLGGANTLLAVTYSF